MARFIKSKGNQVSKSRGESVHWKQQQKIVQRSQVFPFRRLGHFFWLIHFHPPAIGSLSGLSLSPRKETKKSTTCLLPTRKTARFTHTRTGDFGYDYYPIGLDSFSIGNRWPSYILVPVCEWKRQTSPLCGSENFYSHKHSEWVNDVHKKMFGLRDDCCGQPRREKMVLRSFLYATSQLITIEMSQTFNAKGEDGA